MKIIRVEHMSVLRDGRPAGPYSTDAIRDEEGCGYLAQYDCDDCIHVYSNGLCWKGLRGKRPTPGEETLGFIYDTDMIFGFTTAQAMKNWFIGDMKALHRFGFVVGVYDVNKTYTKHGSHQSVFNYSKSKRIGEAPILPFKKVEALV